jgi:COP9 signalosome complex subunit 2
MSDDEYEYEYDDDASMQEEDQFEYTDEEEPANDAEVALENAYYQSKGLRETDIVAAAASFESVITLEQERLSTSAASTTTSGDSQNKKYGPWSYKAMKQLVKLHLRAGNASAMIQNYHRLLQCIAQGDVSPNQIEKGIHGMLERVASLYQGGLSSNNGNNNSNSNAMMDPQKIALQVYDATLTEFHPKTGTCQNERLWFKTNIKYGQLLYEMNETAKLQQVLHELQTVHNSASSNMDRGRDSMNDAGGGGTSSSSSSSSSTQSMEIYALQIQLYSQLKDHKRLRHTFHKAMAVRGGLPHPRTLALIQELGGKMVC